MSIQTTPSIYTVISKSNPTGVYSSLPNSYITNLVYTPSVRPTNPVKGEQYLDSTDNTLYYWNGSSWVSGGGSLPPGTYYGDYLYWNGYNYVVGSDNVSLGANSGEKAQGPYNVAIGYQAGFTGGFSSGDPFASSATGSSVAIGYYAGYEQACNSIAIGNNAGVYQEFNNIAIGSSAGIYQTEINNIAIGIAAGAYNQGTGGSQYSVGGNSIAIGSTVGNNLQGYESVAIGFYAAGNKQGYNSIAIGTNTANTLQGNTSIAMGLNAGETSQGNASIAMGLNAGSSSQGNYSVAIGRNTASLNQGVDSLALGSYAGNTSQGGNTVALGYYAGYNLQEDYSVAIGNSAGLDNQRQRSVAIGNGAGRNTQQYSAIAIGDNAGYTNQQDNCIAIGSLAGNINQGVTGDPINGQAIAIGYRAAETSQGDQSISIGTRAGNYNQHDYGIAIGHYAGATEQSTGCVAIGIGAGSYQQGEYSVAIGNNAGNINQERESIIINASSTGLNSSTGGLYINPVREGSSSQVLFYNPSTKEITYSTGANGLSNIGKDTQVLFNYAGSSTGSNNLSYTGGNLILSTGNIGIGTSNPSYLLHVNGNISPYTINRGNPGRNNTLLLDSFNTTHFYSINASTGFIDISTTMLENAVYEVNFSVSSCSAANDDMALFPNSTTTFGGSTFYTAYQQTSSVPALQYTTSVNPYFMFDMVNGSIGWDPVGKITIYNNRSAKKIVFTGGDTTAPVHGQGYWTNNTGFTSTSGTSPVYDTTTQWSTVGRLQFGTPLSSNWSVWVKRVM